MKLKTIIVTLSVLLSASVFAHEKYVCNEYFGHDRDGKIGPRTVVLTQIEKGKMTEEIAKKFTLEQFTGAERSGLSVSGTVNIENESFLFTSDDRKISFHLYMDELDQSGFTSEDGLFICR